MSALSMLSAEALDELVCRVADEVEKRARLDSDTDGTNGQGTGRWMTTDEAAEYLRCKPQRVRNLRSSRRLTPFMEGGRALCDRREVENLIEEA